MVPLIEGGNRSRLERKDVEFCFIYKDLELFISGASSRDAFEICSL